jgi:hypothetical protein
MLPELVSVANDFKRPRRQCRQRLNEAGTRLAEAKRAARSRTRQADDRQFLISAVILQ